MSTTGMKCPKCGYDEEFIIATQTWATIGDDGCEDHADMVYSAEAACKCRECNYMATVGVFMGEPPEIKLPEERMAVLSTAHLSEEAGTSINDLIDNLGLIGMHREEGALASTTNTETPHASLNICLSTARKQGYDWVLFDRDAPLVDGLPTYEW